MSEFEERSAQYRAQALALLQMSEREIDAAQKSNVAGDGFDLQEDGRTGRRNSATRRQADLRKPPAVFLGEERPAGLEPPRANRLDQNTVEFWSERDRTIPGDERARSPILISEKSAETNGPGAKSNP